MLGLGSSLRSRRDLQGRFKSPVEGACETVMPSLLPLSLLLGLLSLDVSAVGQFMLSRPIVVGPLVGTVTGHVELGLTMGALIELLWIADVPVGAHLPSGPLHAFGYFRGLRLRVGGPGWGTPGHDHLCFGHCHTAGPLFYPSGNRVEGNSMFAGSISRNAWH